MSGIRPQIWIDVGLAWAAPRCAANASVIAREIIRRDNGTDNNRRVGGAAANPT
jgi:hypothetical protein